MPENVKIPVATPQEVTLPISTSRKLFSSIEEKAKPPCKTACDNAAYFSPGQFKVMHMSVSAKQLVATPLISAPITFNFFSGDKMGTSIINSFSASTE